MSPGIRQFHSHSQPKAGAAAAAASANAAKTAAGLMLKRFISRGP